MPNPEATVTAGIGAVMTSATASAMASAMASATVEPLGECCRIDGVLDFDTARGVLETVVPMIESGAIERIDLSGVTRSNSAGLALMIEWLATARRADRPLAFEAVPEGLRQLADVCQVDGLITR